MKQKSKVLLIAICAMLSTTMIVPAFSGPPYYHEEGNVNYPGSYFESTYVAKGIGVDDYITLVDLALLDRGFGKSATTDEWGVGWGLYNPDADIDNDGTISVLDAISMAWGLFCNYHYSPFVTEPGPPKVMVEAPTQAIKIGDQFTVNITIEDVQGLNAFEFTLSWNPELLKAISVADGDFLPTYPIVRALRIGYLYYGRFGTYYDVDSGSGVLAVVTFECLEIGIPTLDLSSRLFDIDLNPMPHQDIDGTVSSGTAQDRIQRLIETIESWNLDKGTERGLVAKLEDTLHLLQMGNENGAIHKLTDFINEVEALRGNKLTNEQADYLVLEAQTIIELIE